MWFHNKTWFLWHRKPVKQYLWTEREMTGSVKRSTVMVFDQNSDIIFYEHKHMTICQTLQRQQYRTKNVFITNTNPPAREITVTPASWWPARARWPDSLMWCQQNKAIIIIIIISVTHRSVSAPPLSLSLRASLSRYRRTMNLAGASAVLTGTRTNCQRFIMRLYSEIWTVGPHFFKKNVITFI